MTNTFKWLFTLACSITLYAIAPRGISQEMPLYFALSGAAVVLWVFELIPPIITAIALTFSYVLFLGLNEELVFMPWSTTLIWIGFGGTLFGEAMKTTGLAKRIALRCLMLVGGSFNALLIGFAFAGLVLGMILPSLFARVVIFCAISISIIDALEIKRKSRIASTLIFMGFLAGAAPCLSFLHTSENFIWAFEVLFGKGKSPVSFWQYVTQGTLINLLYILVSFACVYIAKGKEKMLDPASLRNVVIAKYKEMPAFSGQEKRLLALVLVGISAFMLEPWTGLSAVFVFALSSLGCYIPVFRIESEINFNKINILFLFMMAACIAMGMAGNTVGANKWAVAKVTPLLMELSSSMAVLFAYVSGVLVNFILTPLAATAAFTPAFAELSAEMGVNPLPMFYAFNYGLDQYILPYEMVPFFYIFTTGYIALRHVMLALATRALLTGILLMAIAVPYWKFIGIL